VLATPTNVTTIVGTLKEGSRLAAGGSIATGTGRKKHVRQLGCAVVATTILGAQERKLPRRQGYVINSKSV
jgi:hypothetical protein